MPAMIVVALLRAISIIVVGLLEVSEPLQLLHNFFIRLGIFQFRKFFFKDVLGEFFRP